MEDYPKNTQFDPYGSTQPFNPPQDPGAETQPVPAQIPLDQVQPVRVTPVSPRSGPQSAPQPAPIKPAPRRGRWGCCSLPLGIALGLILLLLVYFFAPLRTNLLVLGVDARPGQEDVGRTDTIILMTVVPLKPYVGMLSIPRDLWVPIPGHGDNRINTAHFFAEASHPGSGPEAARQVVEQNFKVPVPYYVRVNFNTFEDVVNAMGGITIDLDVPTAGLSAGEHHLNGQQALAFARDRKISGDDFYRMAHSQVLLKAAMRQLLQPATWPRLPAVVEAFFRVVDTNIPAWQWPRLGLAVLRAGPNGIDSRTLTREEVKPFITNQGADVLLPQWDKIDPIVHQMFGS